jgi:glycosyltransferase involved in cell wall biosynthesis
MRRVALREMISMCTVDYVAASELPGGGQSVSCLVPAYNAARFIEETLESILAQTRRPDEVIVVDDGSTDATCALVERFAPQVRLVRQANKGPSAARNLAVRESTGSHVAFLDADDLWKPEKLERQLLRFGERPELEISFSGLVNFRAASDDGAFRDGITADTTWPRVSISPCTMVAHRTVFATVGEFDEALRRGEDTEWFVRMMMRKVVYEVLPDELLWRRLHDRNLTLDAIPTQLDVVRMLKVALDRRRAEGW